MFLTFYTIFNILIKFKTTIMEEKSMDEIIIKQISVSFENKINDQKIAKFIKSQKETVGISEYVKQLVVEDMKKKNIY